METIIFSFYISFREGMLVYPGVYFGIGIFSFSPSRLGPKTKDIRRKNYQTLLSTSTRTCLKREFLKENCHKMSSKNSIHPSPENISNMCFSMRSLFEKSPRNRPNMSQTGSFSSRKPSFFSKCELCHREISQIFAILGDF